MLRKPVRSSRIASVGWENDLLEIEFKDGSIYHYFNVPSDVYQKFIDSPSLGKELSKIDKIYKYKPVR